MAYRMIVLVGFLLLRSPSLWAAADPDTLTRTVQFNDTPITLKLVRESVRGPDFEVRVQVAGGGLEACEPGPVRTYLGTVAEYPDAFVAGILRENDELWARIYFDRGRTVRVTGDRVDHQVDHREPDWRFPNLPSVAAGQAGEHVYECDVAVDADSHWFERVGGDVVRALEVIEFSAVNVKAIFLANAKLAPLLARVVIRTDRDADPYRAGSLQFKALAAEWGKGDQAGADRDVVAMVTPHIGGGVSNSTLGPGGFTVNGLANLGAPEDGSFDGVFRHELGHNWGIADYHAGTPEGTTIMCGNSYGRFCGPGVATVLKRRDESLALLRRTGPHQTSNFPPYAALDAHYSVRTAPHRFSPTANDFDVNGDRLRLASFDETSALGGTVSLSAGTGPDGSDELVYTPPAGLTETVDDHVFYRVVDEHGSFATGVFVARLVQLLDFEAAIWNADFEMGPNWNSKTGGAPDGWQTNGSLGEDGVGAFAVRLPGLEETLGRSAVLQGVPGVFYQVPLTTVGAAAIDAGSQGGYCIAFDHGYRRDTATAGEIRLRVSLWDVDADRELAGRDLVIPDRRKGANTATVARVELDYDPTGLQGHGLAVRIARPDDATGGWRATAFIDNLRVTRAGPPVWRQDSFEAAGAIAGRPYHGSLVGRAVDPELDSLVFAKASGPAWLTIAADGTLSGTPADTDRGLNTWAVTVRDDGGQLVSAKVQLPVGEEIGLVNADFEASAWNGTSAPDGWISGPPDAAAAGNYGANVPGVSGRVALLKDAGGNYYQQPLADLPKATVGDLLVLFDAGYRRDAVTAGDIQLRVALWDTTTDTELAAAVVDLADPGKGANYLEPRGVRLAGVLRDRGSRGLALRISHAGSGAGGYRATAMIDNVRVGGL